jgi:hypothetical protein
VLLLDLSVYDRRIAPGLHRLSITNVVFQHLESPLSNFAAYQLAQIIIGHGLIKIGLGPI